MTDARDPLVETMARAIADSFGWKWDWMPSFKDHFTRGCSHEECRAAARAALAAIREAGGGPERLRSAAEIASRWTWDSEPVAALLRALAEGDADER